MDDVVDICVDVTFKDGTSSCHLVRSIDDNHGLHNAIMIAWREGDHYEFVNKVGVHIGIDMSEVREIHVDVEYVAGGAT